MLRGQAEADPPPLPPETTGVPADAPQPSLSPRDIQPVEPEEPQPADAPEDAAAGEDFGDIFGTEPAEPPQTEESVVREAPADAGPPVEAAEEPTVPPPGDFPPPQGFPPEQPAETPDADDLDFGPNPFDTGRASALPTLLPGGLRSRDFRHWVDITGRTRVRGRLLAVHRDGVALMKEDGTIATIATDRLSPRDAGFVDVQMRAMESTGSLALAQTTQDPRSRLLAAADARGNADAMVRVPR